MTSINLGCGINPLEGFINVDFIKREGVDVVHDLETFPYPFKSNTIDYILMDNVLEHLKDTIKVMEELHRISKPNAIIEIIVPHYSSCMALSHITHKRYFGSGIFDTFTKDYWEKYSDVEFKILESRLIWLNCRNWFFIRPLKYLIGKIINYNKFISERFLCYPLGGFDHIHFKLQVIKNEE